MCKLTNVQVSSLNLLYKHHTWSFTKLESYVTTDKKYKKKERQSYNGNLQSLMWLAFHFGITGWGLECGWVLTEYYHYCLPSLTAKRTGEWGVVNKSFWVWPISSEHGENHPVNELTSSIKYTQHHPSQFPTVNIPTRCLQFTIISHCLKPLCFEKHIEKLPKTNYLPALLTKQIILQMCIIYNDNVPNHYHWDHM